MVATDVLFREEAFAPEIVSAMGTAYELVCRALHDRGQPDVVKEIIAKRIIELAHRGVTDPEPVSAIVLKEFGIARA
jgi:hypothetical protein